MDEKEIDWDAINDDVGDDFDDDTPDFEFPFEEPIAVQKDKVRIEANPQDVTQHTLLSYLIANFDAWARAEPIIKAEYFDDPYRKLVEYLLEHVQQYKQIPSVAMVRMKTGVLLDQYGEESNDERTTDWLLNEIQTFCRLRATEKEILRAAEVIQRDSSPEALNEIFQNFKAITEISLEKDLGIEVHRDARSVLAEKEEETVRATGYVHLDRVTGGGFPCPGMVMFAGTSGLGKSVVLANMGVQYCKQGDFVVYISLELSHKRILQRVASMMTGSPIRTITAERDKVSGMLEYRIEHGDGLFRIKKMGMSGTTIANINAYLKELWMKEGIKPSVLCLDYLDLLHPRTRIRDLGNIHVKDKYTAEETYAMCEEWGILCLTASQKVKNNSDMDEFDHASVAGGTPKINTMDYVVGLQRKDKELTMRLLKGRYGGEGTILPFDWDYNTLRITDGSLERFYELNPWQNPDLQRNNAQKDASTLVSLVNKDVRLANQDVRSVDTDMTLNRILRVTNQEAIDGRIGEYP
jgi:replicative DNA helicase